LQGIKDSIFIAIKTIYRSKIQDMEINTLISMANQIGSFFKSFPDKEQASKDIVFHINRFWTLEMRKEIKDNVSKGNVGSDSLDDMVFDAISKYLKV
tara:strand:+ start:26 stop:316 length:291 start_codon:yes stop_codon:yes gene_type:complete